MKFHDRVARKRRIDPGQKIKMVIMRGMGFSSGYSPGIWCDQICDIKTIRENQKKFEDHNGIPKFGDEVLIQLGIYFIFRRLRLQLLTALGNQSSSMRIKDFKECRELKH